MPAAYDTDNIFAKILRRDMPAHKVYEDEATFVMMDIMPRGDGHCLVLPKTPARNIFDIDDDAMAAVMRTVRKIAKACPDAFGADGVTIQQFNEAAGGQVVFHLHVHIIPRYEGVKLRPHTGEMADPDLLAAHADKLRRALG